jgi:hypothetical protein
MMLDPTNLRAESASKDLGVRSARSFKRHVRGPSSVASSWKEALAATKNALSAAFHVWLGWVAATFVGVWLVAALGVFLRSNPNIGVVHESVAPIDFMLAVLVAAGVSGIAFASSPRTERDPKPGVIWSILHGAVFVLTLATLILWMTLGDAGRWDWIMAWSLAAFGLLTSTVFWAHDPRLMQRFNSKQESERSEAEEGRAIELAKQLEESDDDE